MLKLKYSTFTRFDKAWCGHTQVPAFLLFQISGYEKTSVTLALFRFFLSVCLIAELIGYFLITLGLSTSRPVWIFICGVVLKIGGALVGAFFQNRSGTFLSLELQKYLKSLRSHSLEIRSLPTR